MFLFLNCTFPDHVRLALTAGSAETPIWENVPGRDVLAVAAGVLKKHRKTLRDCTGIVVVPGPGPFSRVRAGVAVANTLAFTLDIPLWALRSGKLCRVRGALAPIYGKRPNITFPRERP